MSTMTAPAPSGVRCGNRRVHGDDRVYHPTAQAVKSCYRGQAHIPTQVESAPAPEPQTSPQPPQVDWAAIRQIPVGGRGYGYYALEEAGLLIKFYRVERPKRGKHAGKTFVKVQASDDFHQMPYRTAVRVMEAIAADPEAAGKRYAAEINACYMCGKMLTDADSRQRGVGPTCAKKFNL